MKKSLKGPIGFYDYTVVLTYAGMIFACAGIFSAMENNPRLAVFLLMVSGFCDMFDGTVASTKTRSEKQKHFGIQIDSLADLIGFGVLPGLLAYSVSPYRFVSGMIATLYILAALIRLAYFNVLEEERQQTETHSRKSYTGVPVTTIALWLPLIYLFCAGGMAVYPFALTLALIPMGCGFISPIHVPKPQGVGKIALIVLGAAEAVGLFLMRGLI